MILILIVFTSQITFNTDPKDHDKILKLSQKFKSILYLLLCLFALLGDKIWGPWESVLQDTSGVRMCSS